MKIEPNYDNCSVVEQAKATVPFEAAANWLRSELDDLETIVEGLSVRLNPTMSQTPTEVLADAKDNPSYGTSPVVGALTSAASRVAEVRERLQRLERRIEV